MTFTYLSDRGTVRSSIDFLLSQFLKGETYKVAPVLFSDHSLIFFSFKLEVGMEVGRGVEIELPVAGG